MIAPLIAFYGKEAEPSSPEVLFLGQKQTEQMLHMKKLPRTILWKDTFTASLQAI